MPGCNLAFQRLRHGVILLTPAIGFSAFYPLAGAFLGYYLSPLFLKLLPAGQ